MADSILSSDEKKDSIDDENNEPLVDSPGYHMNAFDAAHFLTRKIRCCRRTEDLLRV